MPATMRVATRVRLTLAAASLLAAAPAGAGAQAPAPAGCTYQTCALRRERVFLTERILAGENGRVVTRPALFGAFPLDSLVAGVPEARAQARRYGRERVRGSLLVLAGSVLSAVAVIDAVNRSDRGCAVVGGVAACPDRAWRPRDTALLAGGVGFNLLGTWRLQVADRALNRAVWYYNRSLPR